MYIYCDDAYVFCFVLSNQVNINIMCYLHPPAAAFCFARDCTCLLAHSARVTWFLISFLLQCWPQFSKPCTNIHFVRFKNIHRCYMRISEVSVSATATPSDLFDLIAAQDGWPWSKPHVSRQESSCNIVSKEWLKIRWLDWIWLD